MSARRPTVVPSSVARPDLSQGATLYRQFSGYLPSRTVRVRHRRLIPPVVVLLGDLVGVIYRSRKASIGGTRTYIHFMGDPPQLVSDVDGRQLYVVGGSYRVTHRGIEDTPSAADKKVWSP